MCRPGATVKEGGPPPDGLAWSRPEWAAVAQYHQANCIADRTLVAAEVGVFLNMLAVVSASLAVIVGSLAASGATEAARAAGEANGVNMAAHRARLRPRLGFVGEEAYLEIENAGEGWADAVKVELVGITSTIYLGAIGGRS
jgi:hypothetical protein